jgi:molecular chaperone HtpG
MSADAQVQQYSFQAEIRQLLQLLSHSLYQNREITIRELISNASDALDKLRFQQLTHGGAVASDLRIDVEPDKDSRVLVIRDNGIGMTQSELIANLGTIARSGSLEFLQRAQQQKQGEGSPDLSLIGKFGVGFYSAFMLADRVEVLSRSSSEDSGWKWESTGDGSFTVTPAEAPVERGTSIRLHLKEGLDEFTDPVRLRYIIRKYSTFVPHPIHLQSEHINDQPPIWLEPKNSVTEDQYQNFFEYLTNYPGQKPIWHLHLSADSPFSVPQHPLLPRRQSRTHGFWSHGSWAEPVRRRILVQNDNRDLLPDYLRFLRGIVDSADLPLNVSREALQDNTIFRRMQKVITRKVLDHLDSIAEENRETYEKFYQEFGVILREGVNNADGNRDRIATLLRFASTTSAGTSQTVSLNEYCDRARTLRNKSTTPAVPISPLSFAIPTSKSSANANSKCCCSLTPPTNMFSQPSARSATSQSFPSTLLI